MTRKEPYEMRGLNDARVSLSIERGFELLGMSDDSYGIVKEEPTLEEEMIHEIWNKVYQLPHRIPRRGGLTH